MVYFLGLLDHLIRKHPEYREKFEQKKADVMEIKAKRRSLIQKKKEERTEIFNSVNEAEYSSWSPAETSETSDTLEIGEAKDDFNLYESVFFSHNYFKRGKRGSGQAECRMCELAQIKTVLKTTDGNTTGSPLFTNNFKNIFFFSRFTKSSQNKTSRVYREV